jgi:hypothetical protein
MGLLPRPLISMEENNITRLWTYPLGAPNLCNMQMWMESWVSILITESPNTKGQCGAQCLQEHEAEVPSSGNIPAPLTGLRNPTI